MPAAPVAAWSAADIVSLQRSIGNAATARLLVRSGTQPVQRMRDDDATGTAADMATLGYHAISKVIDQKRLTYKNIAVQPNGALFIEFRQTNAHSDQVGAQMDNSYDEKVHVPATADDIGARTDIVTRLCLEKGFTAFKTTRPEKLQSVQPGAPIIWQLFKDAGLTDDQAYDPDRGIQEYFSAALAPEKREALVSLLDKHGAVPSDPQGYGLALATIADSVVADSGIFPSEQRGREITIYVDPGFKPEGWWAGFARSLVSRMESANLPRLPIADGDQAVTGEGQMVDGGFRAYFSSRDEGMAMDTVLDYRGFPTWYGGNARESRASGKPLVFDLDLNDPDLDVSVNPGENETAVNAHVGRGKLTTFIDWLRTNFGRRWQLT